jgi:hypothetical protein
MLNAADVQRAVRTLSIPTGYGSTAVTSVGPVRPICTANSELLFPADQQRAARRLQPQILKRRHGAFWIEHSLQVGRAH